VDAVFHLDLCPGSVANWQVMNKAVELYQAASSEMLRFFLLASNRAWASELCANAELLEAVGKLFADEADVAKTLCVKVAEHHAWSCVGGRNLIDFSRIIDEVVALPILGDADEQSLSRQKLMALPVEDLDQKKEMAQRLKQLRGFVGRVMGLHAGWTFGPLTFGYGAGYFCDPTAIKTIADADFLSGLPEHYPYAAQLSDSLTLHAKIAAAEDQLCSAICESLVGEREARRHALVQRLYDDVVLTYPPHFTKAQVAAAQARLPDEEKAELAGGAVKIAAH
jgi:hypothetical protein